MEEFAKQQTQLGQEIERIVSNYKKDPSARKTTKAYYEQRLQRLEHVWAKFEVIDNEIRELSDLPLDHPYFAQDYYNAVFEIYVEYHKHFTEMINSFKDKEVKNGGQDSTKDPESLPPVNPQEQNSKGQTHSGDASTPQGDVIPNQPLNSTIPHPPLRELDSSASELTRILRRQKSMMQSLYRVLQGIQFSDTNARQYFELKSNTISHQWSQIESQNYAIWELTDDPIELGYNVDEYIKLEEAVQGAMVNLSIKIEKMSTPLAATAAQQITLPTLKLPKITLPRFDGDYLKWRQFYDLFTQMVHDQPLSNCQKMWYLKTNLQGEAEKLIRHLSLTEDNYTTAWKILQDRYNNTRILVAALINKILGQPSHSADNASTTAIKSLHDTTQECLFALENMGVPTTNWDPILLHILVKKLDKTTHTLYEQSLTNPKNLQTIKDFLTFLENRFQSLEALGTKGKSLEDQQRRTNLLRPLTSVAITAPSCVSCKESHQLFQCKTFLKMNPSSRLNLLRKHNLCINCMKPGHGAAKCTLRGCTRCNKKHNTLVHLREQDELPSPSKPISTTTKESVTKSTSSASSSATNGTPSVSSTAGTALNNKPQGSYILLSTARVKLTGHNGTSVECRAILDSGSQINIITQRIVKKLGLATTVDPLYIEGIGQGRQKTQQRVNVLLQSRLNGYSTRVEAFVLPSIISPQPTRLLDTSTWSIPHNISLADPYFNRPDNIDLLLGAEFYHQLLSIGQIKLAEDLPIAQNTLLGWIISGKIEGASSTAATCGICTDDQALDYAIERFWRLEELEESRCTQLTPAEDHCETYFNQTTQRSTTGPFIVRLPFSDDPSKLGESKNIALRRFSALERKLTRHSDLKQQYVAFMEEYLRLGHMEEVDIDTITSPSYFLPHHSVYKPDSSTTKLRVVFDASAKTSSNVSLNDILHSGPSLQDDLFSILLRFRIPRFVFTADIEKMYRQVLVQEEDRKYQLIFWRNDPNEPLKCYRLNTVTYGTTSAPYLAIKCLKVLAHSGTEKYPLGSASILQNFYVDDVMTGSNTLSEAIQTQSELTSLLKEGGFKLRKWCSNHPRLVQNISPEDRAIQLEFTQDKEEKIKTLGLTWLPKSDQFSVKTNWVELNKISKRSVASHIARLFDPLGIMSPVIVTAKIFLQQLWQLKLDWDAALPMELHTKWIKFQESLKNMEEIQFPRHVFANEVSKSTQFHAFADASERAYGAAIYVRSTTTDGRIIVRLLCAKSRVAPVKKITLPRLELCAAKLAAELVKRVKRDLRYEQAVTYLWTDSEVVLAWINSSSASFHVFVANRIAEIQRLTHTSQWRHVSSKLNPADVLSRGTTPEKLKTHNLWFYGPPFLHGQESLWPPAYQKELEIPCDIERKRAAAPVVSTSTERTDNFSPHPLYGIEHGNSFRRLQRITAYVLRFINRMKARTTPLSEGAILTTTELDSALMVLIKLMQESNFDDEIRELQRYKEVNKKSSLSSLTPFLDERGIMRVGGRLQASNLPYDAKHAMLLPYSHQWTKLLMTDLHKENLHCGPQMLLATARQRFWPIKGKTLARSVVQHCIRCTKAKPKLMSQIMGNLPPHRIQPARPFINSGVDFCGPFYIHYHVRGKKPQKAYVAVFCCFATKAVHLELVGDLSTEAFIAALQRFIGRRGRCKNLYCDNATNFVGARNQLEKLKDTIYSKEAQVKIGSSCNSRGIDFHFIPPRAPHFGGLWEAAVKSAKYLLQRSMTSASLTHEELETLIVGIEAILNSRPLTSMSSDPNDLTALTPGHFLIGEPLTAPVDPQSEPCRVSLLKRSALVSHLKREFWQRWSREYLNELQHRFKWKTRCQNIEPGAIVIIKEDNKDVMQWPLGRIVRVYKSQDGCIRKADVRTTSGVFQRAIHNLAPLPTEEEFSQQTTTDPTDSSIQEDHDSEEKNEHPTTIKTSNPSTCRSRDDSSHVPRKRARTSLSSLIISTCLVCLMAPAIRGNLVEVSNFNTQPGIHFENLGITNLVSAEWNMIAYYDLQPYWTEFNAFKNGTRTLEHLCKQLKATASCRGIVTQFQHTLAELSNDNDLLSMQDTTSRRKRGVLNIVGNVANALFGVLDSQYAEDMAKTIDSIKGNENHLISLLKNQTSIIDSTINIVKRDQAATDKKFRELENHMAQIINRINDTGEETYQIRISQLFSSLAIQMTLISTNLNRIHSSIVDTLTDSHHGQIPPQLLSPAQLREEIVRIHHHLPQYLKLPASQENILQLYKLITVEGHAVNNYVIFKLNMPLVNVEEFDLLRIWPIPLHINNTFLAIHPCASYLAITAHRDQHYPLTHHELSLCTVIDETTRLCKQKHPVYHRKAKICPCELDLLNGVSNPGACKMVVIENSPIWMQLSHTNQWIYALKENTRINAVCRNETASITLNGSGLLKIEPGCTIKHELVTLQGHYIYSTNSRLSYTKLDDLFNITTPERVTYLMHDKIHYHSQWKELQELQGLIKAQNFDLPYEVHNQTTHTLVISYIGIFLIIILSGSLLYKFRQDIWFCNCRYKPKPAPRQRPVNRDFTINV